MYHAKCTNDPRTPPKLPCKTIVNYENSFVTIDGIEVFDGDMDEFPKLSTYKDQYVAKILDEIADHFPHFWLFGI